MVFGILLIFHGYLSFAVHGYEFKCRGSHLECKIYDRAWNNFEYLENTFVYQLMREYTDMYLYSCQRASIFYLQTEMT